MNSREKYRSIFGKIETLAEPISWSSGVSNMLEWLVWSTRDVLGITKTRFRKLIVELCNDDSIKYASIDEKQRFVEKIINKKIAKSERYERYAPPVSSIASPREALRRAKYFSESYLNKEFDIFWSLVSDKYLDSFYGRFVPLNEGGHWYTHGDGGLFACSTEIRDMQMDNLSYNPSERLLVANELKLGGKKNPDQILKYTLMYEQLLSKNFILPNTKFLLLFISDKVEDSNWDNLIQSEVEYCKTSKKRTAKSVLHPEIIRRTKNSKYASTTWEDILLFNNNYVSSLDKSTQQVEYKLIWGFNETLSKKAFLNHTKLKDAVPKIW